MSELLDPRFSDMRHVFETDFAGMARIPCVGKMSSSKKKQEVEKLKAYLKV